jgi:hypothetical protein
MFAEESLSADRTDGIDDRWSFKLSTALGPFDRSPLFKKLEAWSPDLQNHDFALDLKVLTSHLINFCLVYRYLLNSSIKSQPRLMNFLPEPVYAVRWVIEKRFPNPPIFRRYRQFPTFPLIGIS